MLLSRAGSDGVEGRLAREVVRRLSRLSDAELSYLATVLSSYRRHLLWVAAGQKRADAHYRALTEYEVDECDVLDSLITQGVEIDLDDGVLVSRLRFGHSLQMVASLERKCTDATTRLTRSLTLEKS